jgi:septal ring factor EnvC (AmiA/AmiB activator)
MDTHQQNIHLKEFQLKEAEQKVSSLYNKVRRMRKQSKLTVSDHAIVRYQERIKMLPPDEVQRRLLSTQVQRYYQDMGDGTFPIDTFETTRVVIKDAVVVTVIN